MKSKKEGGKANSKADTALQTNHNEDSRFSSMHHEPIFKKIKSDKHKIKVDSRFQAVLSDDKFRVASSSSVDKYGRKLKASKTSAAVELKEFYEIENDEHVGGHENILEASNKNMSQSLQVSKEESRLDYLTQLARGEIMGTSSDESSEDEDNVGNSSNSSEDEEDVDEDHKYAKKKSPLDIPEDDCSASEEGATVESTTRLALQNCEWENITAQDLLAVLQSFCPAGHTVKKLTVYPSDFGIEHMQREQHFGPSGIWKKDKSSKKNSTFNDSDDEDVQHDVGESDRDSDSREKENDEDDDDGDDGDDDGDDESEEFYKGIHCINDDSEEDSDVDEDYINHKNSKKEKKGDFRRDGTAIGIVLHDDLIMKGKVKNDDNSFDEDDRSHKNSTSKKTQRKNKDTEKIMKPQKIENDLDDVKLRKYELSKLRYYFAIAICDTVETANSLYEQLDGVELEHSAMVFDLRFVPDDISFEGREVRDECDKLSSLYKPPDYFTIDALRHTDVKCSWDSGDIVREKKLTNISQWRNMQDSDFQQYVASSDSDDESSECVDVEDGKLSKKAKLDKAAKLRKLLLGDAADDDEDDQRDDFFLEDVQDHKGRRQNIRDDDARSEEGDFTITYFPEDSGKDDNSKKQVGKDETVFEAAQRKIAERKKARKLAKKMKKQSGEGDVDEIEENDSENKVIATKGVKINSKGDMDDRKEQTSREQLELLFAGEDDADSDREYDMREIALAEKQKKKNKIKKKNKKGTSDNLQSSDFQINVDDNRFNKLFDGDANFGIDKTSVEFKETPGIKQILEEQRQRKKNQKKTHSNMSLERTPTTSEETSTADIGNLVNKIKRKFSSE